MNNKSRSQKIQFSYQFGLSGRGQAVIFFCLAVFSILVLALTYGYTFAMQSNHPVSVLTIVCVVVMLIIFSLIQNLINTKKIEIDNMSLKVKYQFPFKKNFELKWDDCIASFLYSAYLNGGDGVVLEKGAFLQFSSGIIKLYKRGSEYRGVLSEELEQIYKVVANKHIKNFNPKPDYIINESRIWFGLFINPSRVAKKAFKENS